VYFSLWFSSQPSKPEPARERSERKFFGHIGGSFGGALSFILGLLPILRAKHLNNTGPNVIDFFKKNDILIFWPF